MKKVSNSLNLSSTCWGWGMENRVRNKGLQKLQSTEENRSICWKRCHSVSHLLCSLGQTRAEFDARGSQNLKTAVMGETDTTYLGSFPFFCFLYDTLPQHETEGSTVLRTLLLKVGKPEAQWDGVSIALPKPHSRFAHLQ